jgi:hypothetical protein
MYMRQLKTFGYVLARSLTSPAYYADILKAPFGFSLKFFLFFFFIFSITTGLYLSAQIINPVRNFASNLPATIADLYPEELEIKVKDGEASINQAEPYYYPIDRLLKVFSDFKEKILGINTEDLDYLLVIDTQASVDNFNDYRTYALLTQKNLIYYNDNGNLEIVSLKNAGNITLNRQIIDNFTANLKPYMQLITPVVLVVVWWCILWFIPLINFLYSMLFAVITFVIAKLMRLPVKYSQALQLTLHLIVFPTLLLGFLKIFMTLDIPYFRTLLMTLLMTGILLRIKELIPAKPTISPSPPPSTIS